MALGANRDYKTTADRVTRNLKAHKILTDVKVLAGMSQEEASHVALKEVLSMPKAKILRLIQEAQ